MSEVKRYEINGTFDVPEIGQEMINPKMVMESDFDRVTAERDAALAAEQIAIGAVAHNQLVIKELQLRLTAADERADVLIKALTDVREALGREYWDQYAGLDETRDILDAALKPAEGADYRKSCEAAHKALSMENQRIVAPGQFKCLACGDVHPGSGNLPCPKMSPTA